MIKISPSILSADFCNLERDIQRVSSADYLHVDVMDGAENGLRLYAQPAGTQALNTKENEL